MSKIPAIVVYLNGGESFPVVYQDFRGVDSALDLATKILLMPKPRNGVWKIAFTERVQKGDEVFSREKVIAVVGYDDLAACRRVYDGELEGPDED